MLMQRQKIIFAWGKTWWHVFPILALLEQKPSDVEAVWIGAKGFLEEQVAQKNKIFFEGIRLKSRFDAIKALPAAIKILQKHKPKAVFIKGWYVSFPVALAAKLLGIKIIAHESDAIIGKVSSFVHFVGGKVLCWFSQLSRQQSRQLSKFVQNGKIKNKVFLADSGQQSRQMSTKCLHVWQLLSSKLLALIWDDLSDLSKIDKVDNVDNHLVHFVYKTLKTEDKTNLLLIGGSQWSRAIYETFAQLLNSNKDFFGQNFNIAIVGGLANQRLKSLFEHYDFVKFFDFLLPEEIWLLYHRADLSITRAGATSLFEQELFNLKKIIIPLPTAAANHQYYNALFFVLKGDVLVDQDQNLLNNLFENLQKFAGYKKDKNYSRQQLQKAIQKPKELTWQILLEKNV